MFAYTRVVMNDFDISSHWVVFQGFVEIVNPTHWLVSTPYKSLVVGCFVDGTTPGPYYCKPVECLGSHKHLKQRATMSPMVTGCWLKKRVPDRTGSRIEILSLVAGPRKWSGWPDLSLRRVIQTIPKLCCQTMLYYLSWQLVMVNIYLFPLHFLDSSSFLVTISMATNMAAIPRKAMSVISHFVSGVLRHNQDSAQH